jgi:hypothetical protein
MLLCVMVIFVPVIRSCGEVSYGFPTVAIEAKTPFEIEGISIPNVIINIALVSLLVFGFYYLFTKKYSNTLYLREGIRFLYIYHVLILFGFWVVYWLSLSNMDFLGYIVGAYSFLIYGPFLFFIELDILESFSENSRFFGDPDDLQMRLVYVFMGLLWFGIGVLKWKIQHRRDATNK